MPTTRRFWTSDRKVTALGAILLGIMCLVTVLGTYGLHHLQNRLHTEIRHELEGQAQVQGMIHILLNAQLALETAEHDCEDAAATAGLHQFVRLTSQADEAGRKFAAEFMDTETETELWQRYVDDFEAWRSSVLQGATVTSDTHEPDWIALVNRVHLASVAEGMTQTYGRTMTSLLAVEDHTFEMISASGFAGLVHTVVILQILMVCALAGGLLIGGIAIRGSAVMMRRQAEVVLKKNIALKTEADRQRFESRLRSGLAMVETEAEASALVEEVMSEIGAELGFDLLLADSSYAHLTRSAGSPHDEGPLCSVKQPYDCPAVRCGQPLTFETSGEFDACPKLKNRSQGPCSAVCAPITIMGRQVGVLHTVAPDRQPPAEPMRLAIASLAAKFGDRIGVVRAFRKSNAQASTDPLTGLLNRRSLESELKKLEASERPYAVVYCDIDHFKKLNDTHGHDTGDRALRVFSRVLRDAVRHGDVVARWGGEEFVFVLPAMTKAGTIEVIERMRKELADTLTHGSLPTFTASFGVSDTSDGTTFTELLELADNALLAAKKAGRNCYILVGSEPSSQAA